MEQLGRQIVQRVRREAYDEHLRARRFNDVVQSREFAESVNRASPEELRKLELILTSREPDGVQRWVKETDKVPLELMNIRQLRQLAAQFMLPRYSRMSRDELFRAIRAQQSRSNSERNAANPPVEQSRPTAADA